MTTPDLIVFDMIGTTIRASDVVPAAFRKAFETVGVNLSDDDITAARGRSKREAISSMLFESVGVKKAGEYAMQVYDAFENTVLQQYWDSTVKPIDGAGEAFEWCRENRTQVALATGFDSKLADVLVQKLGWQDVVDAVVSNDQVAKGRPAPYLIFRAMEKTGIDTATKVAAIGDTESDLKAGHNAGVGWNIGVLSGAHSERQLKKLPHTAIIASVADLQSVFGGQEDEMNE